MGHTTYIQEDTDDFNIETGELTHSRKHKVSKMPVDVTDEFIKVSKYLSVIFGYNRIPLSLVNISLIVAERMDFRNNMVYLMKEDKLEIAEALGIGKRYRKRKNPKTGEIEQTDIPDTNTIDKMIRSLCDYDILRPTVTRGKYEVNSFLFSAGSIGQTRDLQAHFDFDNDIYYMSVKTKNPINGKTVRRAVTNKANALAKKKEIDKDDEH